MDFNEGDYTPEEIELLNSIARSEGLINHRSVPKTIYTPILKHPLPISDRRYEHENVLRRVLSCKKSFQGMAAISQGDAWTLEEVYMRGGPETLSPKNGNYPIHLAVQMQSTDCVMVLINMGVDLNVPNSLGYTPLFLAHSNSTKEVIKLLTDNNAKLHVETNTRIPKSKCVLDVYPEPTPGTVLPPGKKMIDDRNYLQEHLDLAKTKDWF